MVETRTESGRPTLAEPINEHTTAQTAANSVVKEPEARRLETDLAGDAYLARRSGMPATVPDFRLFQYAFASVEHGSFRRAAAALNVQQSTISRSVRSLEDRVGAKLFERGHAGIRPTPAGNRFLEEVTLGFDHFRRATRRVGALQRGEYGELAIAVSVPFIRLGHAFKRFRERYGGISVEIVEATSRASCASVQRRTVDVAFVTKVAGHGELRSLPMGNERMLAVLPKSHSLAGARRLNLEELHRERFILSDGGSGPEIEDYLIRRAAKWAVSPNIQLHHVGQCNLIKMVAMGFGVTIVVGSSQRAATDGVALVPLAARNALSLHAVWMDTNPNPALKRLLDIVRESGCARMAT
ncbi:MAG: LysR family transcriptional regulator [Mesorhizobium sp.]|nr:LysR family transcriptional regulator [Mesorhizobium sp. M5C.F.Cr.IN.023.01.1.1]RWF86766.1 MAG: LysR family transcriptional regulator [Mesorhizobium sp.]RWF94785.1 MAG: LysR family transcriptional regulator [Mesorhizobium sp.]RWI41315.1 MAG: LysR family transcriptional regulator [Mesorhizobium sp.]RWI49694.1 MAG: LysR family transcriptional regulator [Mesorhizobium sp.]